MNSLPLNFELDRYGLHVRLVRENKGVEKKWLCGAY